MTKSVDGKKKRTVWGHKPIRPQEKHYLILIITGYEISYHEKNMGGMGQPPQGATRKDKRSMESGVQRALIFQKEATSRSIRDPPPVTDSCGSAYFTQRPLEKQNYQSELPHQGN